MNKIIIGIVVVGVGGLLFFLLSERPSSITNYPPVQGPIVALGDSLVYGYGATAGNDFVSVLSTQIGQPIINMGVNGNTTKAGLDRVGMVTELKPSVVLVLLGGNDYLRGVPSAETFHNLDEIVTTLQASGAIVVLLGIQGGVLNDPYAPQFEALAEARGAAYVPNVLSGMLGDSHLMSDAIHPNDAGYRRIAEKVYPVLSSVLQ